nr:immunoglobulin light chain junction region [Mus musculus]NSL97937.1 immunoglobulin light chain junction region [Mus musculus]NSM00295.1 immunoglobulin light chain junction region [Mus musculus]NSM01925.1 immunoglobulin light chain junction region [Mus musculus]NSM02032.1 immunoglobulin light chain junction region [Mus musculus]
CWQGTHFPFTF